LFVFFFFFFFFFFSRLGKQYRVSAGDCIMTDKIGSVEVGQKIDLDEVLLVGSQDLTVVGQPLVDGVKIAATVEEHSQTG
jgi:large subunit ribosomal protein L21